MDAAQPTCAKCSKPLAAAGRAGSLTSFLFSDLHCQCDNQSLNQNNKFKNTSKSCLKCGKVIAKERRKGSMTAFLLKDLRCNCATPTPGLQAGALHTRFKPQAKSWRAYTQKALTARQTRSVALKSSDAALVSLLPGEIIGGCYKLDFLIGKGGMGVVYRATHTTLARTVALKFLAPSMVSNQSWAAFQTEAKINSSLSHPTVCQIYDLGVHANALPFYAMDYIAGKTLEDIIFESGPLSLGATIEIYTRVLEGLSYAHRKLIVHKDIKPANIMVSQKTDQTFEIKLLDFGIAELGGQTATASNKSVRPVIGSAAYMSPEQFAGQKLDLRSDIYSLGCSIFETLAGTPPFDSESFDALEQSHTTQEPPLLREKTEEHFPLEIEAILKKCLHKDRDSRYNNASELAIDLQRIGSGKALQFATSEYQSLVKSLDVSPKSASQPLLAITAVLGLLVFFGAVYAGTVQLLKLQNPSQDHAHSSLKDSTKSLLKTNTHNDKSASQTIASVVSKPLLVIPKIESGQFFVREVQHANGSIYRYFRFPFSAPMMDLTPIESYSGSAFVDMKSEVGLDAARIGLAIEDGAANAEELVKGFRPQDIQMIILNGPEHPESKALQAAIERFTTLQSITLDGSQRTEATLQTLNQLKTPVRLLLRRWVASSNKAEAKIPSVKYINSLELYSSQVSLKNLFEEPEKLSLTKCTYSLSQITLEDAKVLGKIKTLKEISLYTNVPPQALEHLLGVDNISDILLTDEKFDLTLLRADKIQRRTKPLSLHLPYLKLEQLENGVIKQLNKNRIEVTR